MIKLGLVIALCGATAAVAVSSALAVTPADAVGRCPIGAGEPRPVADIYLYGSVFHGLQSADINGDGYTCIRELSNSPTKIVFSDNALPL
jgi:hypothetical protein